MDTEKIRVMKVEIDGLFGQYSHVIPLHQEDRVTILHGRNGVGKTVTLSLLAAFLQGKYTRLSRFPFRSLRIEFSDQTFVEVTPKSQQSNNSEDLDTSAAADQKSPSSKRRKSQASKGLEISFSISGKERKTAFVAIDRFVAGLRLPSWVEPLADDRWLDRRSGEIFSAEELEERYRAYSGPIRSPRNEEPEEIKEFRSRIPVHFIETQRLFSVSRTSDYSRGGSPVVSTVQDVAKEMAGRIKEVDSAYRSTSTRLDNTLPARLFASQPAATFRVEDDLARRTEILEKERKRLFEIGLIADATSFSPQMLNETQRAMFSVYLGDNEEKVRVFRDLADRAEILLGTINAKFAPKSVKLDKDKGYSARSHDGSPLSLDALSSGEQHELVLLHNLLFRVEPGALLLIDEPELSLHVTWQDEFLEELIQIAKKVRFDAIVATHSPYIVGKRRDLMVRLGEPV